MYGLHGYCFNSRAQGPQPIAADFLLNMQAWRAGEPSK